MRQGQGKVSEAGAFLSINNLPGGVGVYELGDTIKATYLSRGLAKLLGYSSSEFQSYSELPLLDTIHPLDRKRVGSQFSRIRKSHREIDIEFRIRGDVERWVRLLGRFARFHGQFPLYYVVVSDTTEAHKSNILLEQQNTRLQFALSHSTLEMWEYEIDNNRATTLSRTILGGHPPLNGDDPLAHILDQQLIHPAYVETLTQDFADLRRGICPDSIVRIKNKDGLYRYLRYSYSFLKNTEGKNSSAIGIFQDVHDEIETRLRLLGKNKAFFAGFNLETGRPVLADNTTRSILRGRKNVYEVFEQVLKTSVEPSFFHLFAEISDAKKLQEFFLSGKVEFSVEARMQHPRYIEKGHPWVRFHLSIATSATQPIGYISIQDINEERTRQQQLIDRSQKDSLTLLFNRISLEEMIADQLGKHTDAGAFYLIDLDQFKFINDTYGHERGDRILKQVSEILLYHFPSEAIIGRLGGDEFVAYLPDCRTDAQLYALGCSLCDAVELSRELEVPCTCSVGICSMHEQETSFQELYQHADLALYRAKEQGRNQCVLYDCSMDGAISYSWTNHEWILDNLPDTIALSDKETAKMLFLNKAGRQRFCPDGNYLGKPCYEVLFNRQSRCPDCTVHELKYDVFQLRISTTEAGLSMLRKEKLVRFHNRSAKLTVLVDQVGPSSIDTALQADARKPESFTSN